MRDATPLPARSDWLFHGFRRYVRRYLARHFHAVRLARGGFRPGPGGEPGGAVLVVVNHASWWDPMVGLLLGELWPDRVHYAPIDSAGLAKYPFLERLGFFGIEPGTAQGGRTFLRRGLAVMSDPRSALWVTAQGRFVDPRDRTTALKPGVGHLAHRLTSGHVVPLALEYPFWEERTPEALARFGTPIPFGGPATPGEWTATIDRALREAQDELAADAMSRDPEKFETLVSGGAGVGGFYDVWRRLKAVVRGERFVAGHGKM